MIIGQDTGHELYSIEWAQSVLALSEDEITQVYMEERDIGDAEARGYARDVMQTARDVLEGKGPGKFSPAVFVFVGAMVLIGFTSWRVRSRKA